MSPTSATSLFLPACALLCALLPMLLMLAAAAQPHRVAWGRWHALALAGLVAALASLGFQGLAAAGVLPAPGPLALPGLAATLSAAWVAVLVQFLGWVIGAFCSRYLEGEPGQRRAAAALAGVLAAVHLLLLADHWLVLIVAWSAVGRLLQPLLCFYAQRPFALLAAHKKRLADRIADGLLLAAAGLCWGEVGSGSLSALWQRLEAAPPTWPLQAAALCLALAVVLRSALLPVHGWLLQVMEAPTPVSALLHAGVVNLGGLVLIRCAPLIEASAAARWLLVAVGLATAVGAGLVMLTRVSIKLRLAWSTVAQMGFMVLECGLGLYTLALLHLLGHSLYKAHAFLGASGAVAQARERMLLVPARPSVAGLVAAPLLAAGVLLLLTALPGLAAGRGLAAAPWPWWWTGVLALAWAPLLWWPQQAGPAGRGLASGLASGLVLVAVLAGAASLGHALPLGVSDAAHSGAGLLALAGMAGLYLCLALLQARPQALAAARRWSYAGFYLDEFVTRATLRLWPTRWTPASSET